MNSTPVDKIWYREPWFWMVAGPLIVSVVASFIAGYIAVVGADDRVKDDYYTEGKAINHRFASDKLAHKLGIGATVQFDRVSGEVLVNLSGLSDQPAQVNLILSHPRYAELDQNLNLVAVGAGRYRADLQQLAIGRWYLQLEPTGALEADKWRLMGEIDLRQRSDMALVAEGQ